MSIERIGRRRLAKHAKRESVYTDKENPRECVLREVQAETELQVSFSCEGLRTHGLSPSRNRTHLSGPPHDSTRNAAVSIDITRSTVR